MTKFKNLKVGEALSELQYYKVTEIKGDVIFAKNEAGIEIELSDKYVEACLISASQYDSEKNLTQTEIITLVNGSANVAMTVNFTKKVDSKDVKAVKKQISDIINGVTKSADSIKKANAMIDSITEGEERTMVGRHNGHVNEFGRLQFIDMQAASGYNLKQVDPRTIKWAIINNVKFTVK